MIYVIRCQHTPNVASSINLIIAKNEFRRHYAKLIYFCPLTMYLDETGLNITWQTCYKLPKIYFFYTFCRPNEKQPKFDVPHQPLHFTIYSLMVFPFEEFLADKNDLG